MNGTRTPPSNVVPLPSRSGPGEPAWLPYDSHGPLSEVKITSVLSSRLSALQGVEDLADRPVDLRDHVAVQPPPVLPLNLSDTNSGTCGIVCGT